LLHRRKRSRPSNDSKTAQVVAMLQTKTGATLDEIMQKMGGNASRSAASWPAR